METIDSTYRVEGECQDLDENVMVSHGGLDNGERLKTVRSAEVSDANSFHVHGKQVEVQE